MRYVVTADEMRRCDVNTIERIGIPGMVLMERAALAARDVVLRVFGGRETCVDAKTYLRRNIFCGDKQYSALVMAGVGNNGGDGLALARLLVESGVCVDVWCVGDTAKASQQWILQRKILEAYDVRFCDAPVSEEYTILVDALFGVGLSREVTGNYKQAIENFNNLRGYKLALDVPSGICSDTGKILGCAVKADETVTFAFVKRGLYLYPGCEYAGKLEIAEIGINERGFLARLPGMFCLDEPTEWLPPRNHGGNKGTFGKVLLIAGSAGMAGAAILCAKAAYRSGAGMVKVLTDEGNREILQRAVPEAMYGTYDNLSDSLAWADVIAIGPGLGKSDSAKRCLERVICSCEKPLLLDADGLNLLAEEGPLFETLAAQVGRVVIITPHVGEMARLTKIPIGCLKDKLWDYAGELAKTLHAVVVAKDARTFVCAENQPVCMNVYGNSGMATAGSGDVLAGVIAGILAQYEHSLDAAFRAACAGVRLHAAAGDAVANEMGEYACMAGDLADAVAAVIG